MTVEAARPANVDDVAVLAAIARSALADVGGQRGGELFTRREARAEPLEDGIRQALDDPDGHVIVGTFDGVPFGYALLRRERLRDGGLLAVVEDLIVDPAARGVGIGAAIMDAALDWARKSGCIGIDAIALPGDRETKNFFESFGLKARALLVHRDLRG